MAVNAANIDGGGDGIVLSGTPVTVEASWSEV